MGREYRYCIWAIRIVLVGIEKLNMMVKGMYGFTYQFRVNIPNVQGYWTHTVCAFSSQLPSCSEVTNCTQTREVKPCVLIVESSNRRRGQQAQSQIQIRILPAGL